MKTLTDQLSQYAAYHRDHRNLLTHLVGIPMIVVAVTTLLGRPALALGALALSPALLVAVATAIYYLRLDLRLGALMTVLLTIAVAVGQWFAGMTTAAWLAAGIGLFVVGWAFQFVGHHYEGRKPAFVDDVVGLLIGPLFVTTEVVFMLGGRRELQQAIESRTGPMRHGPSRPATAAGRH